MHRRYVHACMCVGLMSSTKEMLTLPHIHAAWTEIRKSYDDTDSDNFTQREDALRLARDLGYAAGTAPSVAQTPTTHTDTHVDQPGWHCFSCPASEIVQRYSRHTCIRCGACRDDDSSPSSSPPSSPVPASASTVVPMLMTPATVIYQTVQTPSQNTS